MVVGVYGAKCGSRPEARGALGRRPRWEDNEPYLACLVEYPGESKRAARVGRGPFFVYALSGYLEDHCPLSRTPW